MSVKVMSWVWEHSRSEGTERLVLLAIADYAHDDGTEAWPSVATLAGKAKVSERTVQRAIRTLTLLGEVNVDQGAGKHGANIYTIKMGRQSDTTDTVTPPYDSHPRQDDGVTPVTLRGDKGVTRSVREPSTTPRPPADAGRGGQRRRGHCGKHIRYQAKCENCRLVDNPPPQKPTWCGVCDERTRLVELPDGLPGGRCPSCHPLVLAAAGGVR